MSKGTAACWLASTGDCFTNSYSWRSKLDGLQSQTRIMLYSISELGECKTVVVETASKDK